MNRFWRSLLPLVLACLAHGFRAVPAHARGAAARELPALQRAEKPRGEWTGASASLWEQVGAEYEFLGGLAVNARGDLFFNDTPAGKTYVLPRGAAANEPESFLEESGHAKGLTFGRDGRLYAAAHSEKKIVVYAGADSMEVLTDTLAGEDLAIRQNGDLYVTQNADALVGIKPPKIWLLRTGKVPQAVHAGEGFFSGLALSSDQTILYAADSVTHSVYAYPILPDGSLARQRVFFKIPWPSGSPLNRTCGIHRTSSGQLLIAGPEGIHACDPAGRELCRFSVPDRKVFFAVLAGSNFEYLYAACGDRLYRRRCRSEDWVRRPAPAEEKPRTGH